MPKDIDLSGLNFWNDDDTTTANTSITYDGDVTGFSSDVGRFGKYAQAEQAPQKTDEMIFPKAKPVKPESGRPLIVVIDDDFSTLDLMKIYVQREYDYKAFDNAREAIFYLNKTVPDLIFMDCYMSIVRPKKMVEIIRSYAEFKNVPIYFLAEPDEKGPMEIKIEKEGYEGVSGILTRPVARGELQTVLDTVFSKGETA
ncbi:MAG: response regulator [Lachnospiraceae bacterium]|nr:response regulator [Lachnospiraceae bacterium]